MNYHAFGKRLRTSRLEHDYTLRELASFTHYSPKHLGNVERGDAKPSIELLILLSNHLNTSPDYFLQDSLQPSVCHDFAMDSSELLRILHQYLEEQQCVLQQITRQYHDLH